MTGWNLPPGCTQADIDNLAGPADNCGELEMSTEADIAAENAYWDRETIRWTFDLDNTDGLKRCSEIEIECLLSIAYAMDDFYFYQPAAN